ncbi:MAG: serine/threonine protein kinase [Deltaproteobacteria bacterium]|nr:MAG: serine/threonine protein kinase [Deltaproteobacteria bacterium]
MPLTEGQIIDRYEVLRPLGEGGMAAVYLVRHTTLDSRHALKVLTLDRPGLRERLLQEGRMQAALEHDCAVTVTDVVDVDGAPGLIMEFVEGPTLDEWLRTNPPRASRLALFGQVVGAVSAAHAMGLVHRDLKPGNVLVQTRADGPRAKVTDFGIAKVIAEGEQAGHTRSGTAMGTPAYMAPEQMKDASTVDHRADIWALGAILYELMTGEVALGQGTLVETWERAKTADYPDPALRVPGLEPWVVDTIKACLEPDPANRLESCDAVLASLAGSHAQLTTDSPPLEELAKPAGTGRLIALGGLGAGVLGGGAFVLVSMLLCLGLRGLGGGEAQACSPGWVGSLGYARASGFFRYDDGDVWRLPRRVDVYGSVPDEGDELGEPACFLPGGTEVTLVENPVKAQGRTWVRIGARAFALPEDDE